nr:hypothetical protein [uncultured Flavobacterium sp.]
MFSKDVKSLAYNLLKEKFAPLGYKGNKKNQEFIKKNDAGFDGMFFSTVEYAGLKRYDIKFFVCVRIEEIQRLINLTKKFANDTQQFINPTCIINIGCFTGNYNLNFETFSPEDVENAVETFWKIYNEDAVAHVKKCYDVNFLNTFWKTYGLSQTNSIDVKNWFTASNWYIAVLTVAYLADKDTFPTFRKQFSDYLINDRKMPEDKQIEMNAYLDTISNAE